MAEEFKTTEVKDAGLKSAFDLARMDDSQFKDVLGLKFETKEEATEAPPTSAPASPPSAPPAATPEPAPVGAQPEASKPATQGEAPPQEVAPVKEEEKVEEPAPTIPPRPLVTKFSLSDEQGELDPEDASTRLRIKYTAAGKEREDPLDKVVLLAQMGYANQEREQQVLAAKKFVAEKQQENAELQQIVQEYERRTARILESYDEYEAARERYASENSPDKRASRAEQQLQVERARFEEAQANEARRYFVEQQLFPTLKQEMDSSNGTVTEQEVLGQFTLLTAPLLYRGQLPVQRFAEAQHLVHTELVPWIRQRAALRSTEVSKQKAEQAEALKRSQEAATLAKRTLAQAVAPSAPSAVPGSEKPKPKVYKSAAEWLEDLGGLASVEQPGA